MTEYIANMLTKNMYMDGLIEESDESIYSYSIQLIIEKIIGFSAIYMIALFQGYFFETVLFTISLSNLRKCTGGYHANSFRSCFIGTVSIYLIYIKLIYPYLLNNIKINMIVFLVSAMVIFVLGAVNHPGMDWNKEEFEENKKLARICGTASCYCTYISGNGRKIYSVYKFWNDFMCNFINTGKNNWTGGEM